MSIDSSRIGTASFYKKAIRILKLAKKPDRSEVFLVIKITTAGMAILGLIAYIIRLVLYGVILQNQM
ncbi:MAG: protein translocase SEC61 complex subunit gamma [Candidatus Heimdallarchaeota archaeon]|nr:MAG: protein translocase SEC61 complex subunit gamma [Candidatus Heimdallarchaeota archaeon]